MGMILTVLRYENDLILGRCNKGRFRLSAQELIALVG
jgi:hypothetical protein